MEKIMEIFINVVVLIIIPYLIGSFVAVFLIRWGNGKYKDTDWRDGLIVKKNELYLCFILSWFAVIAYTWAMMMYYHNKILKPSIENWFENNK